MQHLSTHPLVSPSLLHKVLSPTCGNPLPVPSMTTVDLVSVCTLHNLPHYLVACNICVLVLSVTTKLIYIPVTAVSLLEPSMLATHHLVADVTAFLGILRLSPRCYCQLSTDWKSQCQLSLLLLGWDYNHHDNPY